MEQPLSTGNHLVRKTLALDNQTRLSSLNEKNVGI